MRNYFEGRYYKHQANGRTLAVIPGCSNDGAFIQVITDNTSFNVPYNKNEYSKGNITKIGNCLFSNRVISLNINRPDIEIQGKICYSGLTPLRSDIMGFFRFLPMECRHEVISMKHRVKGKVRLNDEVFDFTNGTGYIEGDRGTSFPESYFWTQCHLGNCSVMASAAKIPFAGFRFWGCTCAVLLNGEEYRLATYNGAKIVRLSPSRLTITGGKYTLDILIIGSNNKPLKAPILGAMSRTVHESAACSVRFVFSRSNRIIFDITSDKASYEFAE